MLRHLPLLLIVSVATTGCWLFKEKPAAPKAAADAASLVLEAPPKLCAALRGNGNYVITHFTALARLAEHYGPFDGMAGGSSASITLFLYESLLLNPALRRCDGGSRACTQAEVGLRLSLLLKSIEAYVTVLVTKSDEALAIRGLTPILERVQAEGVAALLDVNPLEAALRLNAVLGSPDIRALVNPEVFGMLAAGPKLAHNVREVYTALTTAGKFEASDPSIFFRPGILNFAGLAEKVGRMGSYYAGYGPFDGAATGAWLDACAAPAKGKIWDDTDATCRQTFADLTLTWRTKLLADEASVRSRIDDPVATGFVALPITAVLTKGTATAYEASLARYRAGEEPAFTPRFEDVRYGYFGPPGALARLEANPRAYADAKTGKRLALGAVPWRTALTLSPAEPGLARLQALGGAPTAVSAAGWPDLHPVLALKNVGCERVVYVTRKGEDSPFGRGIARLLGASEAELGALYDLGRADSSFSQSLAEADAVWCTDWDRFKDAEIAGMAKEAYEAPLQTKDAWFATGIEGGAPYGNRTESAGMRGCTVGAP